MASRGGFYFKPFVVSGQDLPDVVIGLPVSGTVDTCEEKALGLYWEVKGDFLYVKADLMKPGRNTKRGVPAVSVSVDPSSERIIAPHLTLRACLSFHARPFDPLGLVLPTRMIGNILFRGTLQLIKKN